MNRTELQRELELLCIKKSRYSLNGDLLPDAIILFENHNNWEVFYLDERGNRNDVRYFSSESDACLSIYKIFKDSKEIGKKFGINM